MATTTTATSPSPSAASPQLLAKSKSPSVPPIMTTPTSRRTSSNRPTSFAQRRISSYSTQSRGNSVQSRPVSQVYPAFHSSLSYTFVRDFAYPASHPLHYGPQPEPSGVATPASEASRRLSDPNISGWEDSRGQWSATPPWFADGTYSTTTSSREQLPSMTFTDGGPPYSEDEDLRSPVVTTSRQRKYRSNTGERGRSPGNAPASRGTLMELDGEDANDTERYHPTENDDLNGPGGEIETIPNHQFQRRNPQHRDSNFAKPIQRGTSTLLGSNEFAGRHVDEMELAYSDDDAFSEHDPRYSKDYSFTIASPDEEMHGKAIALFDFTPEHENELALQEGQVVLVSYRHGQGWLVAEDPATEESGLVPEAFVRLVKHIEGGLNGLQAVDIEAPEDLSMTPQDMLSPVSNDTGSAATPTPPSNEFKHEPKGGHTPKPSNGGSEFGGTTAKHPAVQSNFSTSSRDFSPFKRENVSPDKEMATA